MIIAGWGKDLKKIGYWGIAKCSNCKNYAHFDIGEVSNNVKVYFITVAKYNKKRYLVCPVCDCGYDLTDEKYNELIGLLPKRFDKEKTIKIWEYINTEFASISEEMINNIDEFISKIKSILVESFGNEENVTELIHTYFQYIADNDKAR